MERSRKLESSSKKAVEIAAEEAVEIMTSIASSSFDFSATFEIEDFILMIKSSIIQDHSFNDEGST